MKKKHAVFLFLASMLLFNTAIASNISNLIDGQVTSYYTGKKGINKILFTETFDTPILSYKIYSSSEAPKYDPSSWIIKGSNDGKKWTLVDERKNQTFCARFQEIACVVQHPATYKEYRLEAKTANNDTLKIADVLFYTENKLQGWENFKYPKVNFTNHNPEAKGSELYRELVQNPDEYVKYHTQKVAALLFFNDTEQMNDVQEIDYILRGYDGISSKSGEPPVVSIQYSTRYIESVGNQSLYKLNDETRGVLYHELVHAYQFEPKGIGSYGTNKEFWACIEGLADAVRAEAGLFNLQTNRRVGGNWLDGYQTTGFFIQWLITKNPNAIRLFNATVRTLDPWSFDAAMKSMFGQEASIEKVWGEYQDYLINTTAK